VIWLFGSLRSVDGSSWAMFGVQIMSILRVLFYSWRRFLLVHWQITVSAILVLICSLLAACSGLGGGASTTGTPTVPPVQLSQLRWCGKPLMIFRDEGVQEGTPAASTPTPVTMADWEQVKANLGFTLFLPAALPAGTCVMSAYGTVHDPIFGGSFTISFLLANHDSISLSEAPLRSQNIAFQCSVAAGATPSSYGAKSGTPAIQSANASSPVQLCTGVREKTNIVFSARGTMQTLQKFFANLQPDVNWVPA
jgi:hypothetical protein